MRRQDDITLLAALGSTACEVREAVRDAAKDLVDTYGDADCIPNWEATSCALEALDLEDHDSGDDTVAAYRRLLADELFALD